MSGSGFHVHGPHEHHRRAQATTALHIAIALAAIALLTKISWLRTGVYAVAGLRTIFGARALLHV